MDLGLAVELAHAHVVDHALPQRGDGGREWAHGSAPVEERGGLPRSSTWQKQRRREQYGRRRSGYRESGLVPRCTADVKGVWPKGSRGSRRASRGLELRARMRSAMLIGPTAVARR